MTGFILPGYDVFISDGKAETDARDRSLTSCHVFPFVKQLRSGMFLQLLAPGFRQKEIG